MATVTGTVTVPLSQGVREDLASTITMLSPDETPLFSNARKTKAKAINHEWQTDVLDTPATNSRLEGDTITVSTAVSTTRLGNILQISERDYGVSGTLQSVNLAGREDELMRLRMKKGLELRRDMEVVLHSNQAKRADSGSTARLLGGLPTWITNVTGVSSAVSVAPATGDGASAVGTFSASTALTYDYLASAHQMAFEDGGAPSILEVPPALKRRFSQLAFSASPSTADVRYEAKPNSPAVAIGSVDKWLSDFGTVDVVVNRQLAIQSSTFLKQAAFLIDTSHVSVAMLRNFEVNKLAKTGDASAEFVVSEYTLAPDAPNAHAAVYGMT
ncbi:MAG: DUF5309 domain-containing protein [Rhodospirillaceae bacterium]|nr:DUF5309 domain-containing protein [Rhodospirillaceae bacterium]